MFLFLSLNRVLKKSRKKKNEKKSVLGKKKRVLSIRKRKTNM